MGYADGFKIADKSIYVRPDGGRMSRWTIEDRPGHDASIFYQTRSEARNALRLARCVGYMFAPGELWL